MENEIASYAASYLAARVAIVLLFGYALFRALRPARARTGRSTEHVLAVRNADVVPDDRC